MEDDGILYVQYNVGNEHLTIDVPTFVLYEYHAYKVIKERCYQWYNGLK